MILNGDCLTELKKLPDNSIDSLVTDPPAGISFMGKEWDSDRGGRDGWIKWMASVMSECKRVLKPGAHGLIWAIPRTSHWTATALEDAGFEVRDVITHLFGSGFPKSLDVSKAIDKAAGAEREVIGVNADFLRRNPSSEFKSEGKEYNSGHKDGVNAASITAPATDSAKQWQGWGTALKPASEHWILIRKPLAEKTVAANVQKHGTGAINIDASRVGLDAAVNLSAKQKNFDAMGFSGASETTPVPTYNALGRFPANLVLSHSEHCTDEMCDIECAIKALDEQSGERKSAGNYKNIATAKEGGNGIFSGGRVQNNYANETGGASRFFYCAKISTSERHQGLESATNKKRMSDARPNSPDMTGKFPDHDGREKVGNHHPTVKPKKLMSYLIRMITPPNGVVLDPFMGSGSTGIAAKECGFKFVGIEKEAEYFEIAKARIRSTSVAAVEA